MQERFLPIGTVVLLHGGTKEVMITTYCIYPTGKRYVNGNLEENKKEMFEYGGCTYPEGILDTSTAVAFNHSQIEKICHMGYQTAEQVEISKKLNDNYDQYKSQYENNEN